MDSRTIIALDPGDDKYMNKYISKFKLITILIWFFWLVIWLTFVISLFEEKMSKISLDIRNERLVMRKVERSRLDKPQSCMDGLNIIGLSSKLRARQLLKP